MQRVIRAAALATALAVAVVILPSSPASARADTRARPILFVHGLDPWGDAGHDCAMWHPMMSALRSQGHTGPMHTIKYYQYDTNCTNAIASSNQDVSIWTLGYQLAWWIWDNYTIRDIPVDVVGHSMGGLITRAALSRLGTAGWPSHLFVEDVVTMGTPHGGSDWASWCGWTQCQQIREGSTFLASLPQNPQGSWEGTQWTLMGSDSDTYVSHQSATAMAAFRKVVYLVPDYGHSSYYNDTVMADDADVHWWDGRAWLASDWAPRSVRWADYALTFGSW